MLIKKIVSIAFVLPLIACQTSSKQSSKTQKTSQAGKAREARDPEIASAITKRKAVKTKEFMIASAHPIATQVGYNILKRGGTATDASVGILAALTLVEPQSAGIGGGLYLLHWDAKNKRLKAIDGRETAPAKATEKLFTQANGKPMDFWKAFVGGRSVGVPGSVLALEKLHKKHGKLPWKSLFSEVIAHSKKGFKVSPRLHESIKSDINPGLKTSPGSKDYFFKNGKPLPVGYLLKNKELAKTLQLIAHKGSQGFYEGPIAKAIVKAVRSFKANPGLLSMQDFKSYKTIERRPICGPYRSLKVCGMPPSSSGGITTLQILGILNNFNISKMKPMSKEFVHLFTQAGRLAFADRGLYLADPAFVKMPVRQMLSPKYLRKRAKMINIKKDMGKARAGNPMKKSAFAPDRSIEYPSTSHFAVIDKYGNAVSSTASIEMAFGSSIMVKGFLLNNQLTDFSFKATENGKKVANRVQPNKRPRSSMAPTVIFDKKGNLKHLIGSPGGSRIIEYVSKAIIAMTDWKLNVQQAINLPNVTNRNSATDIEEGTFVAKYKKALEKKGHKVNVRDLTSGLHGITVTRGGFIGGADSRREGKVMGK